MSFRLERQLDPSELAEQLRSEATEGLTADPKWMRSRWLWDARGAALYEQIMELPEYYLPAAERSILRERAAEIGALVAPRTMVELGPGSSAKTTILLDALPELERFVAIDVNETAIEDAGARVAERYPDLEVVGIVGDFERHLPDPLERTLVICLGSTIGGLEPDDRAAVLAAVARTLGADGALALSLDLVKPVEPLVAAYNDADGLTAGLISNLLPVLNRELGADFRPEKFRAEAVWNPEQERMEMFVRARGAQTVTLPAIGLTVEFADGEAMRTEISTKFTRPSAERELSAAGLRLDEWWTDVDGAFALCLARPAAQGGQAA